jgi:hypothetical protein
LDQAVEKNLEQATRDEQHSSLPSCHQPAGPLPPEILMNLKRDLQRSLELIVPDDRIGWATAIGLFIINFGMLDHQILTFLEERLPQAEFTGIKNWHFKDRLKRVKDLVQSSDLSIERKRGFREFLEVIEPIRDLRNHIARGHLLWRVADDFKTSQMTLSLPKDLDAAESSGPRRLSFEELNTALRRLGEAIETFQRLARFADDQLAAKG